MNPKDIVVEPTFSDAMTAITAALELPLATRRQWCSALAGIARAFDQPPEIIIARYSAIRARMAALSHVPMDWTAKTLANHRSNTKAALLWFRKEKGLLRDGMPLSPAWDRLCRQLTDRGTRYRLTPLMRFCSGVGVEPGDVGELIIDNFMDHRLRTTTRASNDASRRILARLWNGCVGNIDGWPAVRLLEPPVRAKAGPACEDFPEGFRHDVDVYLRGLTIVRKNKAGQRVRGCKSSTLITRQRMIMAAARMVVSAGIPIGALTSLSALIHPDVAEKVFDAYWKLNGDVPKTYTIDLTSLFLSIACELKCLDAAAIERLGDIRFALEQHREEGMTEKNLAVIRQVLTDGVWSRVVNLPEQLLQQARRERRHAPVRAAVLAQIAVAVAILTVAPVRLGNLASIRIGENLTKPGGPDSNFWLTFRKYDVKNDMPLQFNLDEQVTAIINEYIHDFRPALLRGSNSDWLFPGQSGDHKEKISFSTQIVNRIKDATGLRITVHQFRHAAGALILKHFPGNYELVRRILGHKSSETTKKFYLSLETTQASEIYTDIVRNKVNLNRPEA